MTNFPREVCEQALAHIVSDETEAVYRRSDVLAKRRLMEEWLPRNTIIDVPWPCLFLYRRHKSFQQVGSLLNVVFLEYQNKISFAIT
jgi:hypothetical protein